MITNKDVRVENGNLVLNGDKYPLDGQTPEAIMQIVEDNSDTTPTENSTVPITSGGVFNALGTKQDTLTFDSAPTDESTNPVTSGGVYTAIETVKTKTTGVITANSGYTARIQSLYKINGVVYGTFAINADIPISSRSNIGNIPANFRPRVNSFFTAPGSDTINGVLNRLTNVIITIGGEIIVGDLIVPDSQSIKEIVCTFSYDQYN